jgi:signal transduction histidine kinase
MAVLTRQLLDQSRPLSDAAARSTSTRSCSGCSRWPAAAGGARDRGPTELDPALPAVVAHPDAIQQVLANLVDNAVDAMPAGNGWDRPRADRGQRVEVGWRTPGRDPEEHLQHIFEAFYTTKPGVRGVGLGLFVSEGIVRGHRGRLTVESAPARGRASRSASPAKRETLADPPRRAAALQAVPPAV